MSTQLTREAVDKAIAEFDHLKRREFLKAYGFKGARDYFLKVGDKSYDSKAIVAVAHKYLAGGSGEALSPYQLSGGLNDAAGKLLALGYEVSTPGHNADWSWDEHVLALELYMNHRMALPGKTSKAVKDLSSLLVRFGERRGAARTPRFRNAAGVYMKLMNFRRWDPLYLAKGKVGLKQGSKLEGEVWARFAEDPKSLALTANLIRQAISESNVTFEADAEYESEEGAVVLRLHKARERDRALARRKREAVLAAKGKLTCEVCAFDFAERYGTHGSGFIEVHHKMPVSEMTLGQKTKLSDLAVVCSNCHRMLHRNGLVAIHELKSIINMDY